MTDRNDVNPDAGIQEPGGPGTANTPKGAPGERATPSAANRAEPGPPPPGTNQGKNEPMPATPSSESTVSSSDPQAARTFGESSIVPGESGSHPQPGLSETDNGAGADRMRESMAGGGAAPGTIGEKRGVHLPGRTMPGTSEAAGKVDGVNLPHASTDAELGGAPTEAAQEGRALAQGKDAGTHPGSQAVVGRRSAPDGEVSPR